uniref:MIF4G domain-containing protein n=1 Tax=Rhabditophanes sp. KR3021 TaxID=114890 RepID=A0AC35UC06_9BILA
MQGQQQQQSRNPNGQKNSRGSFGHRGKNKGELYYDHQSKFVKHEAYNNSFNNQYFVPNNPQYTAPQITNQIPGGAPPNMSYQQQNLPQNSHQQDSVHVMTPYQQQTRISMPINQNYAPQYGQRNMPQLYASHHGLQQQPPFIQNNPNMGFYGPDQPPNVAFTGPIDNNPSNDATSNVCPPNMPPTGENVRAHNIQFQQAPKAKAPRVKKILNIMNPDTNSLISIEDDIQPILAEVPKVEPVVAPHVAVPEDLENSKLSAEKRNMKKQEFMEKVTKAAIGEATSVDSTPLPSADNKEPVFSDALKTVKSDVSIKSSITESENKQESGEVLESETTGDDKLQKRQLDNKRLDKKLSTAKFNALVITNSTLEEDVVEKPTKETLVECENIMNNFLGDPTFTKDKCFYSNDFIRAFKKAITIFKVHVNPIEDHLKELLSYDKNAVASATMKNKRSDQQFAPSWQRLPNSGEKNRYNGRNSQGGNNDKRRNKQPPVARQSIERNRVVETLTKSENAWKPTLGKVDDGKEAKLKEIRGLLNKITPSNFESLCAEFLKMNIHNETPELLKEITNLFFLKAVEEPRFCSIYSDLCKRQIDKEKQISNGPGSKGKLSGSLISKCQTTFEKKDRPFKAELDKLEDELKTETDEKLIKEKKDRVTELNEKEKVITFGTIRFISQLFRNSLLVTRIISYCFNQLLLMFKNEQNEKAFEQAVLLVETVGKDWATREPNFIKNANEPVGRDVLNPYSVAYAMSQISLYLPANLASAQLPANAVPLPKLSKRLQFMVENLIEMSKNSWNHTNTNLQEGPKKISEVHADIKNEEKEKEIQREKYDPKRKDFNISDGKKRIYTGNNSMERNPDKRFSNTNPRNATNNRKFGDLKTPIEETNLSKTKTSWATGCSATESKSQGTITRTRKDNNRGSRQSDGPSKNPSPPTDRRSAPTPIKRGNNSRIQEFTDEKEFLAHTGVQAAVEEVQYNSNVIKDIIKHLQSSYSNEKAVESARQIERFFNTITPEVIVGEMFEVVFANYTMPKQSDYRCYTGRLIGELLSKSKKIEIIHSIEAFTEKLNDPDTGLIDDCPRAWEYFGQMLASALLYCADTDQLASLSLFDFDKIICLSGDKLKTIISLLKAAFTGQGITLALSDEDKFHKFAESTIESYAKIIRSDDFFISEKVSDSYPEHITRRCPFGQFDCSSKSEEPYCISFQNVRDCISDCPNSNSDELCGVNQTLCDVDVKWDIHRCGKCVEKGKEGVHCIDSKYERLCNETGTIKCVATNNCVPLSWINDQFDDCGDTSDEDLSLAAVLSNINTTSLKSNPLFKKEGIQFKLPSQSNVDTTNNGGTYHEGQFSCNEDWFKCANSSQCIPLYQVLDGKVQCSDSSDENYCSQYLAGCGDKCAFRPDRSKFVCECPSRHMFRMPNGICSSKDGGGMGRDCSDLRMLYPKTPPGTYKMVARNWKNVSQLEDNFDVLCDFEYLGGGWTYIMSRNISLNQSDIGDYLKFNRSWNQFAIGFGKIEKGGEFWLGNDNINLLTTRCPMELTIVMETSSSKEKIIVRYDSFAILDEFTGYQLKLGPLIYTNNILAFDTLGQNNGSKFSTYDKRSNPFCKPEDASPWWSHPSTCSNNYLTSSPYAYKSHIGIGWGPFRLKSVKMMIRPRTFYFSNKKL